LEFLLSRDEKSLTDNHMFTNMQNTDAYLDNFMSNMRVCDRPIFGYFALRHFYCNAR